MRSPFIDFVQAPAYDHESSYESFIPGAASETPFADSAELEQEDPAASLLEIEEDLTDSSYEENEFAVDPQKGITDYINVSAVTGLSLTTGVFIPSGFKASPKINIVVYLHGLFRQGDKRNGIEHYWKNYANIREYFYAARRNAILIAPTLSRNPQTGAVRLNNPGGFDKFLDECLSALRKANHIAPDSDFGDIIVAGHSAGGKPLARVLQYAGKYRDKIIETWGMDCLYADWWGNSINSWAQGSKIFYHYWAWSCNPKKLSTCPKAVGDRFTNNLNFRNIAPTGKIGHRQVIENAWTNQILNRSWFDRIDSGLVEPEYDDEVLRESLEKPYSNEGFVPDLAKSIRLNQYYSDSLGWKQYHYKINDLLLPLLGEQGVSLGQEDFAEAVSLWQKSQGFPANDCDGVIGPGTWARMKPLLLPATPAGSHLPNIPVTTVSPSSLGFVFSSYRLSTTPLLIQKINSDGKYAQVLEPPSVFLKKIVSAAHQDPDQFFDRFTRITFLGRQFKPGHYLQEHFAIHLKKLESQLAVQYGGSTASPSIAGDVLGLSREGFGGSRTVSETATISYHMFGMAVDVNYNTSPFIQALIPFNRWLVKVAKLVKNCEDLPGIDWRLTIRSTTEQYLKLYDDLSVRNDYIKKYFAYLDPQNENLLVQALRNTKCGPWNTFDLHEAKAYIQKDLIDISNAWAAKERPNSESVFKNGFLGISRNFVKAMVESGLDWGGRYGDIMHFDMRTTPGIGREIEKAKTRYKAVKKKTETEYENTADFRDQLAGYEKYNGSTPISDELEAIDEDMYNEIDNFFDGEETPDKKCNCHSPADLESLDHYGMDDHEEYPEHEHNDDDNEMDYSITDLSRAVVQNRHYSSKLGWNRFHDQINNLLLPLSGLQDVTLGEEAFAEAVAEWQTRQGFSPNNADGIIGPDTWARMRRLLPTPAISNAGPTPSGLNLRLENYAPEFENYTLGTRLRKVADWAYLLGFKVPDDIISMLRKRNMSVQYAHNESYSNDLNVDFYQLRIYKFPVINGRTADAASLAKYVRLNINRLIDTSYCDFLTYEPAVDNPIWNNDNPRGAVLKLDIIGPDNASVVVSLAKPNGWRFSTVHTPDAGEHPVSGHREFFVIVDPATGGTYFVIKGLDILSNGVAGLGLPLFGGLGYSMGDSLWKSYRAGIIRFINANGGSAKEMITYSERVPWRYVYHRYKGVLQDSFGKGAGGVNNSSFFDFELDSSISQSLI